MSPWKVILATMVIFICGVVTGSLVTKTEMRRPPPTRGPGPFRPGPGAPGGARNVELLRRMDKDLSLDSGQHERIDKIMRESQDRTQLLWTNMAPAMQKEVARMRGEIHDQLTPEQQKLFDAMLQSRPRWPEGFPARDGDPFHHGTNRFRTNGPPSNMPPTEVPATGGLTTNSN